MSPGSTMNVRIASTPRWTPTTNRLDRPRPGSGNTPQNEPQPASGNGARHGRQRTYERRASRPTRARPTRTRPTRARPTRARPTTARPTTARRPAPWPTPSATSPTASNRRLVQRVDGVAVRPLIQAIQLTGAHGGLVQGAREGPAHGLGRAPRDPLPAPPHRGE